MFLSNFMMAFGIYFEPKMNTFVVSELPVASCHHDSLFGARDGGLFIVMVVVCWHGMSLVVLMT